ncbi:FMN-dependent NADH-azoreductase [Sulfitobacter noctilucae]|uniref:FMN-dependent NADH-azoreductase n=1 Tax=Sulfitobacter noctilucae TaxID=1342302 RepID=UPI00046A3AAE|nr:NAD(P)H-dependent oxidoreductase [Sulfitobacter noctilucae]KIN65313.1 FMN-dependent NADH-azoreductase [Sulfitobacter noctilucae]
MNILRIDSSANLTSSVTRRLTDQIVAKLGTSNIVIRDLAKSGLPQIDNAWTAAGITPKTERTADQHAALAQSDALIAEIRTADTLVIGIPIYNFSVAASLKAWIDLICRAGETFQYTATGPVGLLKGKRAILVLASGGTQIGSEMDYASGYMRQIMNFIGIEEVEIVAADALMMDADAAQDRAATAIDKLAA